MRSIQYSCQPEKTKFRFEKNQEDKNIMIEEFKKSKIAQDFQKNFPDAKFVDLEEKD